MRHEDQWDDTGASKYHGNIASLAQPYSNKQENEVYTVLISFNMHAGTCDGVCEKAVSGILVGT